MKIGVRHVPAVCAVVLSSLVLAQEPGSSDIQALREELKQMRIEYESRISDLESRLEAAELAAQHAPDEASENAQTAGPAGPASASPQTVSIAADNSFNPAIGVTFQGQAWAYDHDRATGFYLLTSSHVVDGDNGDFGFWSFADTPVRHRS